MNVFKSCWTQLRRIPGQRTYVTTPVQHEVYISTCRNIYYNLALEDWIHNHHNFSDNQTLLLLWRNEPCVVIGRHQNPWAECDVRRCEERQVKVARRRSGGGTVYHDLGNLNCSFFTHKRKYNRTLNLQLIADALTSKWGIDVSVSARDDLLLNKEYKISGTAAKLGGKVAYHHCTLLFNTDMDPLNELLRTSVLGLRSKATESVRSQVKNLQYADPSINYEALVQGISSQYLQYFKTRGRPLYVDPTSEPMHPGIHKMCAELKQWQWIYGKTPNFSIERRLDLADTTVRYKMHICKGLIDRVEFKEDPTNSEKDLNSVLKGARLQREQLTALLANFSVQSVLLENPLVDAIFWDLLKILS